MMIDETQVKNGEYYTFKDWTGNTLFQEWFNLIPEAYYDSFIEPFAGSGNIIKMVKDCFSNKSINFKGYDIHPCAQADLAEGVVDIEERDSLADFPKGKVVITNPPYLAKNNTAINLDVDTSHIKNANLYHDCIETSLKNADFVAMLVPSGVKNLKIGRDRLLGISTLPPNVCGDVAIEILLAVYVPKRLKIDLIRKHKLMSLDDFLYYEDDGSNNWHCLGTQRFLERSLGLDDQPLSGTITYLVNNAHDVSANIKPSAKYTSVKFYFLNTKTHPFEFVVDGLNVDFDDSEDFKSFIRFYIKDAFVSKRALQDALDAKLTEINAKSGQLFYSHVPFKDAETGYVTSRLLTSTAWKIVSEAYKQALGDAYVDIKPQRLF